MTKTRAAIWVRVSTDHQEADNQVPSIRQLCRHRSYQIAKKYELNGVSAYNGDHKTELQHMLDDAHRGEFSVLVVWSVDRLTRSGIEDVLRIVRELRERGVSLVSVQEPWLSGSDATTDLLLSIGAWVAHFESTRRSERVKAGLAKRRAAGLPMGGRQAGAKDRKPRQTAGYRGNANARRSS